MPQDGDARLGQRPDLRQEGPLQLDGAHAAFPDKASGVEECGLDARLVGHEGHVRHDKSAARAPHDRPAMMDHLVQRDRDGILAPEHDHPEGVAHEHHVDSGPVHDAG